MSGSRARRSESRAPGDAEGHLVLKCPRTGRLVVTRLGLDAPSLARIWRSELAFACPHCGDTHRVDARAAYLEQLLQGPHVSASRTVFERRRRAIVR